MRTPKRIIGFDPAIRVAGYSVLDIEMTDRGPVPKITYCGIFDSKKLTSSTDTAGRTKAIVSRFAILTRGCDLSDIYVAIEEPPGVTYKKKGGGTGRALSLYPVISVAYAVYGYCQAKFIPVGTLYPNVWQKFPASVTDSKAESKRRANAVLEKMRLTRRCTTKNDENIADAINISIHTFRTIFGDKNDSWNL